MRQDAVGLNHQEVTAAAKVVTVQHALQLPPESKRWSQEIAIIVSATFLNPLNYDGKGSKTGYSQNHLSTTVVQKQTCIFDLLLTSKNQAQEWGTKAIFTGPMNTILLHKLK